jgi:hypothetical protein
MAPSPRLMDRSFCFFFQKEGLFFFEKKNQKTFIHEAIKGDFDGVAA